MGGAAPGGQLARAWQRPNAYPASGRPVPSIVDFGSAHTWCDTTGESLGQGLTARRVHPRGWSQAKLYTAGVGWRCPFRVAGGRRRGDAETTLRHPYACA